MAQPRLTFAAQNGQSSIRVIFDQRMREVDADSLVDARNASLWSTTGTPPIDRVERNSPMEYEVYLTAPMVLGAGYTVTVAGTVESSNGLPMDGSARTASFDVTAEDLRVVSTTWGVGNTLVITFSDTLSPLVVENVSDVIAVTPADEGRQLVIRAVDVSGVECSVTFEEAGTAGAVYDITLVREQFVTGPATTLKAGDEAFIVFGQGDAPTLSSVSKVDDVLTILFDEDISTGAPPYPGVYQTSSGSLGSEVDATATTVAFPEADLPDGLATVGVRRLHNVQIAGQEWTPTALVSGPVSEVAGAGTTTITKAPGGVGEVAFIPAGSTTGVGRQLSTTVAVDPGLAAVDTALFGLMFPSTSLTIMFVRHGVTSARAVVYRGETVVRSSAPVDISGPLSIRVVDATGEATGHLAVQVNGVVIVGASHDEVIDTALLDRSVSPVGVVLFVGDPADPAAEINLAFVADFAATAFVTSGLLGLHSLDLLSFDNAEAVINNVNDPLAFPGFQNTGKGAFGVHAEYIGMVGDYPVDAIKVVVALNEDGNIPSFVGSCVLFTATDQPFDMVGFTQDQMTSEKELVLVFLHPKVCQGVTAAVTLTIDDEEYTARVPAPEASGGGYAAMAQQPASWWRPRVDNQGVLSLHPATITGQ